jgi:hypothetical protein
MLGMKTMSTSSCGTSHAAYEKYRTRISSKSSVPDNCIVLKGEVLEYRDSLTHSANESGWIQRLHYDQSMA